MTSDEQIFNLVRTELKRARGKYTKNRNPKQALNPIKAEIYECQNELEYDEPDYQAARTELIHVIATAIRAIDSIDCEIARREKMGLEKGDRGLGRCCVKKYDKDTGCIVFEEHQLVNGQNPFFAFDNMVQPVPQWIDVNDRLPKAGEEILVTLMNARDVVGDTAVVTCEYYGDGEWEVGGSVKVLAWMESKYLPAPYEPSVKLHNVCLECDFVDRWQVGPPTEDGYPTLRPVCPRHSMINPKPFWEKDGKPCHEVEND